MNRTDYEYKSDALISDTSKENPAGCAGEGKEN